jgi:hypothetical protein
MVSIEHQTIGKGSSEKYQYYFFFFFVQQFNGFGHLNNTSLP